MRSLLLLLLCVPLCCYGYSVGADAPSASVTYPILLRKVFFQLYIILGKLTFRLSLFSQKNRNPQKNELSEVAFQGPIICQTLKAPGSPLQS